MPEPSLGAAEFDDAKLSARSMRSRVNLELDENEGLRVEAVGRRG